MLDHLFPLRLQLTILQLEWYNVPRFLTWIGSHFTTRTLEGKKRLVWNLKAKLVYYLAILEMVALTLLLFKLVGVLGLLIGVVVSTFSFIFLAIAALLLKPFEVVRSAYLKARTRARLAGIPKLKTVAIAGSYAKTSTKNFLYQLLRPTFKTLKTPGNYNTPLGIAKVVDLELYPEYEYFIYEGGSFGPGDIRELAELLDPAVGIVTGLNEQHLERFGSVEAATRAEWELVEHMAKKAGTVFINVDNEFIKKYAQEQKGVHFIPYGFADPHNTVQDVHLTAKGTHFTLLLNGHPYKAETSLMGNAHLTNILTAATVAHTLGVPAERIVESVARLKPAPHRLEVTHLPELEITLIDNSYNSNTTGFQESLALLHEFKGRKIVVTPGIVELGAQTGPIHQKLGALVDEVADQVFLVGKSERTQALEEGVANKNKITYLESIAELWPLLRQPEFKGSVVLLENDLPDNY